MSKADQAQQKNVKNVLKKRTLHLTESVGVQNKYPETRTHCKKDMSAMENMPISCSHLFPQTLDFFSNSLAPLLRQGQRIASPDGMEACKET